MTATYSIRPAIPVQRCGQLFSNHRFAFDAAWEEFDTVDLAPYFWDGLTKLRKEISILENPLRPYTNEDQKRFTFMVESLLQVRKLMDDRGV